MPATRPSRRSDGRVRLAIFGFVNHYKGYELALRALALLPREISLVIAGGEHPRDNQKTTIAAIEAFLATGVYTGGLLPPLPERKRKAAADAGAGVKTLTPQLKPLQEAAKKAAEQKAAADKVAAEKAAAAKVAADGAAAARQAAQRAAADKAEFDKSNNAQASAAK